MATSGTSETLVLTGSWTVDPARSRVGCAVKHIGIATVRGEFTDFEGTLQRSAQRGFRQCPRHQSRPRPKTNVASWRVAPAGPGCAPTMLTIAPETDKTGPLSITELAAWRGMLQMHARVTQALDAQMRTEHGLSLSAYEVLMFLAEAPDRRLRMSQIADRVLLSRSGLTRLVDRLVELGHVTRCAAESDGRGAYAELTDAGLEKFQAAQRTHRAGVRDFFLEHLNTTDMVVLGDIWTRLAASRGDAAI